MLARALAPKRVRRICPMTRCSGPQLLRLFTSKDERVDEAIRVAVTSQSTRKRITSKLMNELATALILRAVAEDRGKVDQVRRYLRHAFSKSTHRVAWQATGGQRSSSWIRRSLKSESRSAMGI